MDNHRRLVVPIIVILLLVIAASAAGCSTISIPGISQSHVQAFVNAMHDNNSGSTTAWQETKEDSNTIRIQYTSQNGSTATAYAYDLRVKEFPSVSDATNFVQNNNQGYAISNAFSGGADNSVYTKVMGHDPSKTNAYISVDSLIPFKGRVILQMDEFVIYGSGVATSSASAASASSTPTVSAPTVAPSTTHNAILESIITERQNAKDPGGWKNIDKTVTWHGDNSVTWHFVEIGATEQTANTPPATQDETFTIFPTIQDATNYINSRDLTGYKLDNAPYNTTTDSMGLNTILGTPTVFHKWWGPTSNSVSFMWIYQRDNLVQVLTGGPSPKS